MQDQKVTTPNEHAIAVKHALSKLTECNAIDSLKKDLREMYLGFAESTYAAQIPHLERGNVSHSYHHLLDFLNALPPLD